jgi:hypothetical protein
LRMVPLLSRVSSLKWLIHFHALKLVPS